MTSKPYEVSLQKDQAAVLAFVLEHVEATDEIEVLEFALAGEFGEPFRAAVLGMGIDDDGRFLSAVVTLPTHSDGVFLGITAYRVREVARMLANLEDYERDTGRKLYPLECVVTDGPEEIKALFLLRTASHGGLASIPDVAVINGKERRFSLVIGLNDREYSTKVGTGADALLDMLQESDKSLVLFGAE